MGVRPHGASPPPRSSCRRRCGATACYPTASASAAPADTRRIRRHARAHTTSLPTPQGPADPILGLTADFNEDERSPKYLLGVGAYRDDAGKPYVLPSVREAEARLLAAKADHEYAGMTGVAQFTGLAAEFAYGKQSAPLDDGRVAITQTLSGTGACRLVGDFWKRFGAETGGAHIYLPNPTWGNHLNIFKDAGLETRKYSYLDANKTGLDHAAMLEDVAAAPAGSLFLLHACAHNPTGVDPSLEQWKELSQAFKAKGHIAFFDSAYQGFASGDAEHDAAAIRLFVDDGHPILLGQSFAKNFGLYGERVGALSFVCADKDEKARVESQLKILVRPMYSNPPVYGARIVAEVLKDPELWAQWSAECKGMAHRIIDMRQVRVVGGCSRVEEPRVVRSLTISPLSLRRPCGRTSKGSARPKTGRT